MKRLAHVAGALICVLAIALLIHRGISIGDTLGDRLRAIPPSAFARALVMYVVGGLLLGLAWVLLVRVAAATRPRALPIVVSHLRAQLAKYLPGNVFHLAYRHLAAHREGVSHQALAFALGLESVLLLSAAALLAVGVATDSRLQELAPFAPTLIWAAPLVALAVWLATGIVGHRIGAVRLKPHKTALPVALVLAIDLAFFALAAVSLRALCARPEALPFGAWCGWLSLAWALGYVTPGAPAGLGLREAVLALGLAPVLGEAEALALALAYRLLTLLADAALALVGFVVSGTKAGTPW